MAPFRGFEFKQIAQTTLDQCSKRSTVEAVSLCSETPKSRPAVSLSVALNTVQSRLKHAAI